MSASEGRALPGTGLRIRSGAATHVGRVREQNEDCLLAEGIVFAVADGMGGHAAGEVASRLAVQALATLNEHPPAAPEDVTPVLAEANRRIVEAQAEHPGQRGMGTTVAGLTVIEVDGRAHWVLFNIGDSRVYRIAGEELTQVTRDHSEVRELLDAGLIDEEEAARHPMRNVITRSLGSDPAPAADVWELEPAEGERFVVCSDGLSNELGHGDIGRLAAAHADPQDLAEQLVAAAVDAGGRDNVSVVVVAVERGE